MPHEHLIGTILEGLREVPWPPLGSGGNERGRRRQRKPGKDWIVVGVLFVCAMIILLAC